MADYSQQMKAHQWISPPVLAELEQLRRAAVWRFRKITFFSCLIYTAGVGMIVLLKGQGIVLKNIPPFAVFGVIFLLLGLGIGLSSFAKYRAGFKARVIGQLVAKVDAGLKYKAEGGLTREDYDRSLIFAGEPYCSKFQSEDLIEGVVAGMPVRMSEVHAARKTRETNAGEQSSTRHSIIFRGMLLITDSGLDLGAPLIALPRGSKRNDPLNESMNLKPFSAGDQALDSRYCFYSTNQVAIAQCLTPALRRRLLTLPESPSVRLSLVGSSLYVAIRSYQEILEPPYFSSIETVDFARYIEQVRGFVSLLSGIKGSLSS